MKLQNSFLSSIRFKIFVIYAVFLWVTLTFFNFFLFLDFKESQERKIDALLDGKAQAVESALRASWETQAKVEGVEAKPNWFVEMFGSSPKKTQWEDPYETIIRYLNDDTLSAKRPEPGIFLDIFGPSGREVYTSGPEPRAGALDPAILSRLARDKKVFYILRFRSGPFKGISQRAVVKAILDGDRIKNIVQARISTQRLQSRLRGMALGLFFRSLIVVLLASGGSFLLVWFTLRPVDEMTRAIRNIKPDNLSRRIQMPRNADEIARLAETFNAMLDRLERSFRSQKQIVQDISHELKTPLTIIHGQIEVILKKKRSASEYEEALRSCLEETHKVRKIIDNLLLLAKFDNPAQSMEMRPLDVSRLLESAVQDARILGAEKSLEVTYEKQGDVTVYGNEVHLDRLFRNLMDNAVKYNVSGGRVDVTATRQGRSVEVVVRDTGIGIAPEETAKIFDRFYRVDRARSSGDGFGLGLSLSKSIVDAHRGQIGVESRVGSGTRFWVKLPADSAGDLYQ